MDYAGALIMVLQLPVGLPLTYDYDESLLRPVQQAFAPNPNWTRSLNALKASRIVGRSGRPFGHPRYEVVGGQQQRTIARALSHQPDDSLS